MNYSKMNKFIYKKRKDITCDCCEVYAPTFHQENTDEPDTYFCKLCYESNGVPSTPVDKKMLAQMLHETIRQIKGKS